MNELVVGLSTLHLVCLRIKFQYHVLCVDSNYILTLLRRRLPALFDVDDDDDDADMIAMFKPAATDTKAAVVAADADEAAVPEVPKPATSDGTLLGNSAVNKPPPGFVMFF